MAVVVRLRRMGSTNKPFFRIVAADERTANNGRFLETIGWYDPKKKGVNYEIKLDRIDYWKDSGARITDTVASLVRKVKRGDAPPSPASAAKKATPTKMRKVSDLPAEDEKKSEEPAPVAEEKPAETPADKAPADTDEVEDKKEVSE